MLWAQARHPWGLMGKVALGVDWPGFVLPRSSWWGHTHRQELLSASPCLEGVPSFSLVPGQRELSPGKEGESAQEKPAGLPWAPAGEKSP